jgi:hypothetical protein
LLAAATLALDACWPAGTEGDLGNGRFGYVCTDVPDTACTDGINTGTVPLPDAIAVGASFSVIYLRGANAEGGDLVQGSSAPSILEATGSGFQFRRAGTANLLVFVQGGVLDFAPLNGVDANIVTQFGNPSAVCSGAQNPPLTWDAGASDGGSGTDAGAGDAGPDDAGADAGQPALPVDPQQLQVGTGIVLTVQASVAGQVDATLTISDPSIASSSPSGGSASFNLCGLSAGMTTIVVTALGKTVSLPLLVTGGP